LRSDGRPRRMVATAPSTDSCGAWFRVCTMASGLVRAVPDLNWPAPRIKGFVRALTAPAIVFHRRSGHHRLAGFAPPETPMLISTAFAQTAAPAAGPESSLLSFLPLVAMFVVLYFIMIRPQMKRQKEHKAMIEALAKGDEVVTAGGLLGKVTKLGDSHLHVELAQGVEVQLQRSAVVQVLPKGSLK
jgi:preprotein translocase subunit YajC